MNEWSSMLTDARVALNMSQAEVAARAHVSLASVKAYERGKRHPSRPYLTAMLDGMRAERTVRNAILAAAGYAMDGMDVGPWFVEGFMYTRAEAEAKIDTYPWPAFISNEFMEVCGANRIAQRLWGVDLAVEFQDPISRNLLTVASNPRFADKVENLREALAEMATRFKSHHRGGEEIDQPSPYFASVLQRFLTGDPKYIAPFLEAFQNAEPVGPKIRWEYPMVWNELGIGRMTLTCVVSSASEPDGLAFNDWIPVNAESWTNLQRLLTRS